MENNAVGEAGNEGGGGQSVIQTALVALEPSRANTL